VAFQLTSATQAVIEQDVSSTIIQPLVANSVILQQGPHIFQTSAPLRVPRLAASTNVGYVAEGAVITNAAIAVDEVDLLPSSREGIKSLTVVSNELVRSAVLGVSQVLSDRIAIDVARFVDHEFINGTGGSSQITGLLTQSGISTTTYAALGTGAEAAAGSLGDPTFWIKTVGTFAANHLNLSTSRWILNPSDWYSSVLTSRDSLGRLLFIDNVTGSMGPGAILGIPACVSTQIPPGTALLADFSRVFIAQDQSPSVALLTERYADQDSSGVRVTTRWDLQLAQPEAVLSITAAA
jgi:HK97 family phage major capsid protein